MADFFGRIKSGAGKAAFEVEKMGRVNKAQWELNGIRSEIDSLKMRLGDIVYQQFINPVDPAPAFEGLCQQIQQMEMQAAAKADEIQRINADVYIDKTAAPVQPAAPYGQPPQQGYYAPGQPQAPYTPVQPQGYAPVPPAPYAPVQTGAPFGPGPVSGETPVQGMPPMPEQAPVTPAPEAAPVAKFCTNCGKPVPAGMKFCPECGNKMA